MEDEYLGKLNLFIIDSSLYQKLKPIRYCLYVVCFLLFALFIRPTSKWSDEINPNLIEMIGLNFHVMLILLICFLLLTFLLFAYSKNYQRKGLLEITPMYIRISLYNNATKEFSIKEIENFKISRGSTLHYAHRESVPPETNDNWIYFKYNFINYKYEFMLNFDEENIKFEKMINALRRKYSKFYYESI